MPRKDVACQATNCNLQKAKMALSRKSTRKGTIMANNNLTELVFILDRSGSMCGREGDTIGGFNSTIAKQRKEAGDALVTTVLFDDRYELLHNRIDLKDVPMMTEREYYTRGCTALLDAVGRTIENVREAQKAKPKDERPGKTVFVIITDGLENASTEFTASKVKHMIGKRSKKGWEFIYLGANIDAIAEAGKIGISEERATNFAYDTAGFGAGFDAVDGFMSEARACNAAAMPMQKTGAWKRIVERDFFSRK